MNPKLKYNQLESAQLPNLRSEMRQAFGRCLTAHKSSQTGDQYTLQLEILDSSGYKMFNHRMMMSTYASDVLVAQTRFFIHQISFFKGGALPEVGVFVEQIWSEADLWELYRRILLNPRRDCQALRTSDEVNQVLAIPSFRDYLPPKMRDLDFHHINQRAEQTEIEYLVSGEEDSLLDFKA